MSLVLCGLLSSLVPRADKEREDRLPRKEQSGAGQAQGPQWGLLVLAKPPTSRDGDGA